MLVFKRVKFKNFGSFGNTFTQIDLDRYNTVLVSGKNGHGKSFALLDSITFGLFGKPFRNIPQTQLDSFEKTLENLGRKQQAVLRAIDDLGMASNRMIAKKLGWEINRVTGRVTELVNLGKVTSVNTTVDKDTNRTVTLWQVLK